MMNELTTERLKYIIARVIDNANDAAKGGKENPGDAFNNGKKMAYYEVLDTIKNELDVSEQDLEEYGLNFSLEELL